MKGNQSKTKDSSFYNEDEQICVVNIIEELLKTELSDNRILMESDIGVISPYRQQCNQLSERLRKKRLEKIAVGTAEIFQGQERLIIIISTVRSDGHLGFVADKRVCTLN